MTRKRILFRLILAALLASTLVAWGVSTLDSRQMARHLSVLAEEKVKEYREDPSVSQYTKGDADVTATVSAGRQYALYGQGVGKVTVFLRTQAPGGGNTYSAIEFYYELKDGGQWVNTESAMCVGAECREPAQKAFARDDRSTVWRLSSNWF